MVSGSNAEGTSRRAGRERAAGVRRNASYIGEEEVLTGEYVDDS